MLRGSGRMIQRATTMTASLPLSKSLLHTLLKRVSASKSKGVASFLAGTRYQSGHLMEFCRKCRLCFRSTAVSWSGNPACSIKEAARDSCSSTRLGTHRYSGDDSQSGCGTQANTYSDRTRSQGASSDPGEGSLERRLNGRQLYVRRAVDSEGEVLDILVQPRRPQGGAQADAKIPEETGRHSSHHRDRQARILQSLQPTSQGKRGPFRLTETNLNHD